MFILFYVVAIMLHSKVLKGLDSFFTGSHGLARISLSKFL